MTEIRLVHIADVHLGYTGNKSLVFSAEESNSGRYVREVDIERALQRLTKDLVRADPPIDVLIIAGDLFHGPVPSPRAIATATRMIRRLIQQGIDVVIVDGNHDNPKVIHTGSPATFLKEFGDGVHVVNQTDYKVIRESHWLNARLHQRLAVHCLPYRAVLREDFAGAIPHSGCFNVLVAHGRVGNMPNLNTLGLSVGHIPPEVLRRGWDYIALGDWHIHRYQPLAGVPAYYAGSLEALKFSEAQEYPFNPNDPNALRGAIDVRLCNNGKLNIQTLPNNEQRPLLRLKSIDATNMDAETLMNTLRQRLDSGLPSESLVLLTMEGCSRSVWGELDHEEIQDLRKQVRGCYIRPSFVRTEIKQSPQAASSATLEQQWQHFLEDRVPDEGVRERLSQEGLERIEAARQKLSYKRADQG